MLADEVISLPMTPELALIAPLQRIGYLALAEKVALAQRFVLRQDAVVLIHEIAHIPMARITPALPLCRMPFPIMWVELIYRDRADWQAENNIALNKLAGASDPVRLGYLLEQKDSDGRSIDCTLVWKHRDEPIVIGGYSMHINTHDHVEIASELRAEFDRAETAPTELEKKFCLLDYKDPQEREAALELETRITLDYCLYMAPFWTFAKTNMPKMADKLRENAVFDCLDEWRFVIGLLTVLNSRNVVGYSEPVVFDKINKARVKKKVPPLHDYREIRVAFSPVQRNRLGSGNLVDVRAHLVRGHWKLRRTGLYWWSPHVRGSGDIQDKPYLVRP